MPKQPGPAWERLGETLLRRRIGMDARYRNRRTFVNERAPDLYRIINDVELGRRDNYESRTKAAVESAYDLPPGALDRFIETGSFDVQPEPAPGRPYIPVLEAGPDIGPWENEVWNEVAEALAVHGPAATGTQVFPASRTEAKAWDSRAFRDRPERVRFIARTRQIGAGADASQETG